MYLDPRERLLLRSRSGASTNVLGAIDIVMGAGTFKESVSPVFWRCCFLLVRGSSLLDPPDSVRGQTHRKKQRRKVGNTVMAYAALAVICVWHFWASLDRLQGAHNARSLSLVMNTLPPLTQLEEISKRTLLCEFVTNNVSRPWFPSWKMFFVVRRSDHKVMTESLAIRQNFIFGL